MGFRTIANGNEQRRSRKLCFVGLAGATSFKVLCTLQLVAFFSFQKVQKYAYISPLKLLRSTALTEPSFTISTFPMFNEVEDNLL